MAKKKTKSKKNTKNTKSKNPKPEKVKNKKKKKPTEVHYHSTKEIKVEKALVENFIGLQKVMVNLSSKFDKLSDEISKLLNIFEVSAKAMAKKEFASEKDPELKKIIDKLENISKQAGLIGKGVALIHESNEEKQGEKSTHFEPHPSPIKGHAPEKISKTPLDHGQMRSSIMEISNKNQQPNQILQKTNSSKTKEIEQNKDQSQTPSQNQQSQKSQK